ncbi:MAG: CHAT domain-containing protein [Anaerolineales bacterium]|nr:CHAT domain-containing protein [Anaerolineales bacterium]
MAVTRYQDFLIVAEDVQKDETGLASKFSVTVFDSPVGQGEKKEIVAFPAELPRQARELGTRRLDNDVERQIDLGEALAGLALPPYARQMFAASLARLADGEGLRLRLRLADELQSIPWEYLYIQEARGERTPSSFLALDPRLSIVRDQPLTAPPDWFGAPGERRALVAITSPQPYSRYPALPDLPKEQASLRAALAQVPGLQAVYLPDYSQPGLDRAAGATLEGLIDALMMQARADIFHFSGHGEFSPPGDADGGQGGIVLADSDNRAVPLAGDRLGELLRSQGVRLVVLSACQTGRSDERNVWGGVAASLIKARIPAVVAMQFSIYDDLAAAFGGAFYRALVAGYPLDYAVAVGRAAMRANCLGDQAHMRDWGAPVLYLRPGAGAVFNPVSDKRASQAAVEGLSQLVEQHARQVSPNGRMFGALAEAANAGEVVVRQLVDERASGVMIGGYVVSLQGGKLSVSQQAEDVDGVMIGAVVGAMGEAALDREQALARLADLLRMEAPGLAEAYHAQQVDDAPASAVLCPVCGNTLHLGAKFCDYCGSSLRPSPQFCTNCAAKLPPNAKFCVECGLKVAR